MADEVDGEKQTPLPSEFTAEQMARIRDMDVQNIRVKAELGKVLTREEMKRLELAAGETMASVGVEEWATSQSDLAAKLKVSDRKSIQRWLKLTGMQAPPGATPDGRYNVKDWAAWMERTGRSGRVKEPASAIENTKSKLALIDLRMKEIELDTLQGRMIELDECKQVLTEVMSKLSQAFRGIKHRIGPSVVGVSVPEATKRIGAVVDETLAAVAIAEAVKKKSVLEGALLDALRPPTDVAPWLYVQRHFKMHNGGDPDPDLVFQHAIMEAYADPAIRKIACQCSAQSTKTVLMYFCAGWSFLEDAGPMLWVTKSKPAAVSMVEAYLWPFFEASPKLAAQLPNDRQKKKKLSLYFGGHYFNIAGADTKIALQSLPYRYLFLDEVRSWRPGALEMVSKRTRSYPHNFKQFMISTPDHEGDMMDRAFREGSQEHWFVPCVSCGHEQELKWGKKTDKGGVKWDTNELTCPNGRWNEDEVCKTLRFECEACGHQHRDIRPSGTDRRHFCRAGRWVAFNPTAPSDYRSFTWNALLPHFTDWTNQLKEWLRADEALKNGDFTPLKDHINETRGETWADHLRFAKEDDFLKARERDYLVGDPWPEEICRFMTIDVQGKGGRHYYVTIRAWGQFGESRKLHHEKVWTRDDLVRLQNEWKVDPKFVGVDSAYSTTEIYKLVVESGMQWKALRGEEKQFFTHPDGAKAIWAMSKFDPALGTQFQGRVQEVPLFLFSAPATRERLVMMMYGDLGDWQLPRDEDHDYKRMVTAWDRRFITEGRSTGQYVWYQKRTDDHYEACERMQIGMAAIRGLLQSGGQYQMPLNV